MSEKAIKATSSVKSGVTNVAMVNTCGGMPPKKSVEQIEKVNTPSNAPKTAGV